MSEAERRVQWRFSFGEIAGAALLLLAVAVVDRLWSDAPDRKPRPPHSVALRAERLPLDPLGVAPLRLAGAWRLSADDPRFGGLSALVLDRGALLALNDSGAVIRFPRPGGGVPLRVHIADLPDGPGSPLFKEDRDSEALARDPLGRGWWIGFERYDQLWLFDEGFRRKLGSIRLGGKRWPDNRGVESLLADRGRLTVLPELGNERITVAGGRILSEPLDNGSMISDAARLPGGEVVVLLRDVGPTGFRNALGLAVRGPGGWRVERRIALNVGRLANLEGLAVEPRANGGARLWLVTDDNFQPPQETVLIALDVPPGAWPGVLR